MVERAVLSLHRTVSVSLLLPAVGVLGGYMPLSGGNREGGTTLASLVDTPDILIEGTSASGWCAQARNARTPVGFGQLLLY